MKSANPDLPEPKTTPLNLGNPDLFKHEMESSGFTNLSVRKVTHSLSATSPDDFWDQMTRGSARIVMMKKNGAPIPSFNPIRGWELEPPHNIL